ncbi:hypothetical protein Efla_001228 [Eimeria flavescens]
MAVHLLMEAVKAGRRDLVLQQLLKTPAAVNEADCNGTTPVILAARLNSEAMVKDLLSHGGDPEAAEAAERREMVSSLLAFGASPNQQNAVGQTPMHVAARAGCKGAVEQMLAAGGNPAVRDGGGFDAAYWAEHGKHSDLARLLPPPKCLTSKELALFQLLAMDQLGLTVKMPSKKKGKRGKRNKQQN